MSVFQNGGVYDAIIVQRNGKDKYRVREGNCRTVASRHLLDNHPNDTRFMTMPAMVFDVDLTEEDLAVLLADMHVAGKIRWDAYEQAKHVYDLHMVYGKTYDWLSDHLRLSKSKITELLSAYKATNEYLHLNPTPGNVRKFSLFHEVVKKKDLRERFNESMEFKQKFHKWVTEGRVTDSKQVRDLPLILENPEAANVLEEEGFEEAQKVLIRNDPSLASDLFLSIKNATEKLKKAPANDLQDLKSGDPQKLIMLRNLHRAIEDLATLAGVKL
jgi:transposase